MTYVVFLVCLLGLINVCYLEAALLWYPGIPMMRSSPSLDTASMDNGQQWEEGSVPSVPSGGAVPKREQAAEDVIDWPLGKLYRLVSSTLQLSLSLLL